MAVFAIFSNLKAPPPPPPLTWGEIRFTIFVFLYDFYIFTKLIL
ncbi:hypothetical protein CKA32_004400 [Geitlerinema sp. FC II]|nr:hypothetical protein CKA32_004400 [Geitlerinema sp. FC II]